MMSCPGGGSLGNATGAGPLGELAVLRERVYGCFRRRADCLFELVDAVLCAPGRVGSLAELSLEPVFRRGHGALYDAVACGEIDTGRLARVIAGSWRPVDEGPLKFACDVSAWPRPHAETLAQRHHCHTPCRCGNPRATVPGWPYSFVVGLEWGANSWSVPLDVRRLELAEEPTAVTAAQVEDVIDRCAAAGLLAGREAPLFAFDAGYDLTRIAYLLREAGVEMQLVGRVRRDRVFHARARSRAAGTVGRPLLHGERFKIADPGTWHSPDQQVERESARCGHVTVSAWHGLHQKLARQAGWVEHAGQLPIIPGTLIRIEAEHLPGNRAGQEMWLWHHAPDATPFDLDLIWMCYLRRFDIEHTFRFLKQQLGWSAPRIATPGQGDRWSWLVLAAYTQLRLARHLGAHLRRPWQRALAPGEIPTPGRVRRGFAVLARKLATPAGKPKPTTPGPGRPKGSTRPSRPPQPVGKNRSKADKYRKPRPKRKRS